MSSHPNTSANMKLNIVVPCFNEEAVLQETTKQFEKTI
jgi:glycosyltransferase involved in cell wall biosynthesis